VNKPDHELIAECLGGQTQAFGELVVRYQDRLCNGMAGVLGSAEEGRDVAQDAFVQAFEKLASFRGQSTFYSWLFRIALNASVTRQRRRKRVPVSIEAVRELAGREPADEHPRARPDHGLELSERQQSVRSALSELSDEFRTVLVLKEIEGLKYEEIAEIVDCPIGTVRSRIHRARLELREKLNHLWP
jgi:RNA polymerase sigma-70 factor (ECF subfamily)